MPDMVYSEGRRLDRLRVLIVEDNARMASILRSVLSGFGIRQFDFAKSAYDGLELLLTTRYDIVLLDFNLPSMDGIEFIHTVRTGINHSQQMIPIILVTGYTERSRIIAARDAGVTEVCAKPVTARDLWNRIAEVINAPRPFVRSKSYTGPDRRRHGDTGFDGEEKRHAKYRTSGKAA